MADQTNDESNLPNDGETLTAIWKPAWHELDQTLVVDLKQRYFFFDNVPENMQPDGTVGQVDLVFFNDVDANENVQVRVAKVAKIEHAVIGEIIRVDTFGLDYILYPFEGEEIVVDAEEEPGVVRSGIHTVDDWTMKVTLTDVSDRIRVDPVV
ncbi:MAG: hypothetical protein AAFN77_22945 [Planctomycetota bacterium]